MIGLTYVARKNVGDIEMRAEHEVIELLSFATVEENLIEFLTVCKYLE